MVRRRVRVPGSRENSNWYVNKERDRERKDRKRKSEGERPAR